MYKLENNVEWTTALKNAFKTGITKAKIIYDENIEINYDNGLKEVILEDNRYVPEIGFIGQATAKKVTLTLLDNEQTTNLENKEFTLYIGADYNGQTYYINYGNFIVYETPQNDSTNGTIKIIAYDYMVKFNQVFVNVPTFPCTMKTFLENVCSQAGVTLATQSFPNDDFIVDSNQFEGKQMREILQNIAKSAFSWARIGQDNCLYFDFSITSDVVERVTPDDYKMDKYKKANESIAPITRVILGQSNIQGQEGILEDEDLIEEYGVNDFVINDNYFGYTQEKRDELVEAGDVLFGFTYMPVIELALKGTIYLDCTDLIEVEDENGDYITTRAFCHTIKYNGAISDSISAEAQTKTEEKYQNYNEPLSQEKRTEIIVDRQQQTIDSLVKQAENTDETFSEISQTLQDITSTVATKTEVNSQISELQQTIDGISSAISTSGGNNLFYYAKEFWTDGTQITEQNPTNEANLDEYTNTEIRQLAISQNGYMINNGISEQVVDVKNNDKYTISFMYKLIEPLASVNVSINGLVYNLTETDWTEFNETIDITTKTIDFKVTSDTDNALMIYDLMGNLGIGKEIWTQNPNETRTDTITIGKGIQVNSTVSNIYTRIDNDGNRIFDNNNNVITEMTDKGITTKEIESNKAEIGGILIQEINGQTWISSLL